MFNFYKSTNLILLGDKLVDQLSGYWPKNPLEQQTVVVQNHGMAHWLSLYLAEKQGVAANLKFEFPAERIWSLIRQLNPEISKALPSDRKPMALALMQLLDQLPKNKFEQLTGYIAHGSSELSEFRRWKLAQRISDIFDQYLTYRPDMLQAWQNRKLATSHASERWQMKLWNRLQAYWQEQAEEAWRHQTDLYVQLLSDLRNGKYQSEHLPDHIIVFGVGSIPPIFLEVFSELSKYTDIHWFYTASHSHKTNPFLESMGKKNRDFEQQLEILSSQQKISIKHIKKSSDATQRAGSQTLFTAFKKQLSEDSAFFNGNADKSIQVHSCHSAMREIEVLYDQLLGMMDKYPALQPPDILVLTPDLSTYAPLIDAVFGSEETGKPSIPYHITERSYRHTNSVYEAFKGLLRLASSRFKAPDVLDFLSMDPIRHQFGFSDEQLRTIEQWTDDTGIKWGVDGVFKSSESLPGTNFATWKSGLQRIMLGYAMNQHENKLFQDIYPYEEIEGIAHGELAGKLNTVLSILFETYECTQIRQSLSQWSEELLGWIDFFFSDEEPFTGAVSSLRSLVQELPRLQKLSAFGDQTSYSVVSDFLTSEMNQQSYSRYAGPGVTFSSLIAMRNIPAKVVAMIGMNEGDFPRSKIPAEFDLIFKNPQPGDRIQRQEDRQLFLDAILAAEQRLYISYVGKSNRQDTTFPPSVVVGELFNYLESNLGIDRENLHTVHPLQPFSPLYFGDSDNTQLFSYSQQFFEVAQRLSAGTSGKLFSLLNKTLPEAGDDFKNVSLDDLASFFRHPAKFLLQNRLDIFLMDEQVMDEDREAFALGGLENYQLKQNLLDHYLNEGVLEEFKKVVSVKNLLPEGWPGEKDFQELTKEVEKFGNHLKTLISNNDPDVLEVDPSLGSYTISGKLKNIFGNRQLGYRLGKPKPKDIMQSWIFHLMFQLNSKREETVNTFHVGYENGKIIQHTFAEVSKPKNILQGLLNIYWEGLHYPVPFFPATSHAFAKKIVNDETAVEDGIRAAQKEWINNFRSYGDEGEDSYNQKFFKDSDVCQNQQFQKLAEIVWLPILRHLNKERI